MATVGPKIGQTYRQTFTYTTLAGQTVFGGFDVNGLTLNYVPRQLDVFINGLRLSRAEYTAVDGSTITLAAGGGSAGRTVEVVAWGSLSPTGLYSNAQIDTMLPRPNKLWDPGFQISQENGNSSVALPNNFVVYPTDSLFVYRQATGGDVATQRIVAPTPGGSAYRVRTTVTAPFASPASGHLLFLQTMVEALDITDLRWGTATARPVSLRLGIRSSVAGTFTVSLRNNDYTRSWLGTISVAPGEVNTDLLRTLLVPGDVLGTWLPSDPTLAGLRLGVVLMSGAAPGVAGWQSGGLYTAPGQTNWWANSGATFDLFDLGLYPGSTVPAAFDLPPAATSFARAQRYYELFYNSFNGDATQGTNYSALSKLVPKRGNPSLTLAIADSYYNGGFGTRSAVRVRFESVTIGATMVNASQPSSNWYDYWIANARLPT